ncbi:isoform 3 of SH3 domain-containing YSC84-like protein 1 [Aspergillus udagawae]|uniref:Isoform 3 of SH3 domain-containing YSC84-like protein 1 n=1 Tax=Aspergillus udagawae TaxID=91492 RepID=A0A8H3N812_9EURO|nr:isoform 3 of SH3 domain-containing YSC84-like protein 1 [Aspergillus udagawae]
MSSKADNTKTTSSSPSSPGAKKSLTQNKAWIYGKKGFDKAWDALDKVGAPVNRLSNKLGSEAFWPMTLDKESEKASRILRSFCKDGVYVAEDATVATREQTPDGKIDKPRGKPKVLQKIPAEVIRQAKGIAIFTAMRTGLWFSGAGGSGILVARVPETGEWSAPSGILLHTAGLGFLAGIDIYDCVMVINTYEALEAFTKVRVTLGSEISVAAGPVGMGGVLESEVHKRRAPIWSYVKSRGFYAGAQIDGTILIERNDENERFYGRKVPVKEIVAGHVRTENPSVQMLTHTLHSAQGDKQFDLTPSGVAVPTGPSPSDFAPEDLANSNLIAHGALAAPAQTATATSATANDRSIPVDGSQSEEAIVAQMESMGFARIDIDRAMRAASFNPDIAVEYLLNGIPDDDHPEQHQQPAVATAPDHQEPPAPPLPPRHH